jgi:hypothetical protein
MTSREGRPGRAAIASAVLVVGCSSAGWVRADETPLVVVGGVFESPTLTAAPIVFMRVPVGAYLVTVSQTGWTSGLVIDVPRSGPLHWETSGAFAPIYAHLSHDVFAPNGMALVNEEFNDTSLRIASGVVVDGVNVRFLAHGVVGNEWVSGLAVPLAAPFATPFGGGEAALVLQAVRGEDPIASRLDGIRLTLRGEGLAGASAWADTDAALSLGRRIGPLFARLDADAFYASLDGPLTDFLIGGSWDVLGAMALYGHPLGAFRVAEGFASTAGLDLRVLGPIEVGVRGSLLAGTPVVHEGVAALVRGDLHGIDFFVGAGTADGSAFQGDFARSSVFLGATGALFFLP